MNEQNYTPLIVIFLTIGLVISLAVTGFFLSYNKPQEELTSTSVSALVLSPTPTPLPQGETEIESWEKYNNDKYSFSIDKPVGWNVQEYKSETDKEGTLIAFSPNMLPCETCTYLQDGYFSLKIYNEKSSPQLYALFQQNKNNIGKSNTIRGVTLDNEIGVVTENTATVEHQGWVYEFTLDGEKKKINIEDSKIFQRAVASIQFTSLDFNF